MILYVSGGMSGHAGLDFHTFNDVARLLRKANHLVLNPAENWGGRLDVPRAVCMRQDIQQVLLSEGVASIEGWEKSEGASLEHEIARQCGIPSRPWKEWLE